MPKPMPLIGGAYNPSSTVPLSPLTIIAGGLNEELIQFRNACWPRDLAHLRKSEWDDCLVSTSASSPRPGLPPTAASFFRLGATSASAPSPRNRTSVSTLGINLDQGSANKGALSPGLTFGSKSGEGIASNRAAGGVNANGLDFYAAFAIRMSLTQAGRLGLGTLSTRGATGNLRWPMGSHQHRRRPAHRQRHPGAQVWHRARRRRRRGWPHPRRRRH